MRRRSRVFSKIIAHRLVELRALWGWNLERCLSVDCVNFLHLAASNNFWMDPTLPDWMYICFSDFTAAGRPVEMLLPWRISPHPIGTATICKDATSAFKTPLVCAPAYYHLQKKQFFNFFPTFSQICRKCCEISTTFLRYSLEKHLWYHSHRNLWNNCEKFCKNLSNIWRHFSKICFLWIS